MTVAELKKELRKYENDFPVCIFDWRKSVYHASEEPNSEGIYVEFKVEIIKEAKPFIALSFSSSDYEDA